MIEGLSPNAPIIQVLLSNIQSPVETIPSELPDEIRKPLRNSIGMTSDMRVSLKRVQEASESHGLRGLVIWYDLKKTPSVMPQPVHVPFEPLELDEKRAPLGELVAVESDQQVSHAHAVRRTMIRMGMPLFAILPITINAVVQLSFNPTNFNIILWALMLTVFFGIFVLMWFLTDDWYIVPGGVVVRRSLFRRVGEKLRLFTPDNTMLVIRPGPPGFFAEVWKDGLPLASRRTTLLEASALVGAWHSDLDAPPLEQLSDMLANAR